MGANKEMIRNHDLITSAREHIHELQGMILRLLDRRTALLTELGMAEQRMGKLRDQVQEEQSVIERLLAEQLLMEKEKRKSAETNDDRV